MAPSLQSLLESAAPFQGLLTRQQLAQEKREARIAQLREEREAKLRESAQFKARSIAPTSQSQDAKDWEREEAERKVRGGG
jgi:hypothetical protein